MKLKFEHLPKGTPAEPKNPFEKARIPARVVEAARQEAEFLDRGVFFDAYAVELPDADGNPETFLIKDFRSGDVLKRPEEQVALFQHQYYEWGQLRHELGEKFFPESYWIRSPEFTDDEAHGFYAEPGKTPNTMAEVLSVQLDRQLANRYGSEHMQRKNLYKKMMSGIGSFVRKEHTEKPFIGAIVQKKVNGIPFAKALERLDPSDPSYAVLRENTRELIRGLHRFHNDNPQAAFTWHGIQDDNVVAEIDENGKLTGNVYVLDANFTERPTVLYRKKVLRTLSKNVFDKLDAAFHF